MFTTIGRLGATLALGAFLALATPAMAEGAAGTWNVEIDTGDAILENQLVITADLKGKLVTDEGEVPLTNVKFEDGTLTFEAVVPYAGEELEIEFEGDVDGNELDGYIYTELGEVSLYGERAVMLTIVGTWDIEIDTGDAILENQLVFTSDSAGTMVNEEGEIKLSDVAFEDGELTFNMVVPYGGEELDVEFEGEIDGNELDGYVYTEIGEASVYGERRAASALIGKWNAETDTGDQVIESVLVFTSNTEGKQVYDQGEIPLRDVKFEDGELTFSLTVPYEGNELEIEFEGEVDGDEIDGYVYTEIGEAPLYATRAE